MTGNESVSTAPTKVNQEVRKSWSRWSLKTIHGNQFWEIDDETRAYSSRELEDFSLEHPQQHSSDKVYREQFYSSTEARDCPDWMEQPVHFRSQLEQSVCRASTRAIDYFTSLQTTDGHWAGDYGGPMFLLPGLIIASHVTETPFPVPHRQLMQRYMLNHQLEDGGWGLHIEGDSTMFGTVMQYTALRLLGMNADEPTLVKARKWIHDHGGAENTPSWGKFFLAVLGVIDWKGCNSLAPELWLLPRSLPLHPGRYWCHTRMVYLPMSYCYGVRMQGKVDALILNLRKELLSRPYEDIKWNKIRFSIAKEDVFHPMTSMARRVYRFLNGYEALPVKPFRKKAVAFALDYVKAEDTQTRSIDIGPVNQVINSLVIWHACGRESKEFRAHVSRWKNYLWVAEDGMKMNGYNGSQLWDTAFAVQAMTENSSIHLSDNAPLLRAYDYIREAQIVDEVADREKYFRHASVGGWPFSTLAHGWPISDCTAEGLKAALAIHRSGIADDEPVKFIPRERLEKSADLILSFQNSDGGWATYENSRGPAWLEALNPSEVYGKIMIDYSWVECTSACVTALIEFQQEYGDYRTSEVAEAIQHGLQFIIRNQRDDGSWVGSWGVCFTYGTWFALEALTRARDHGYGEGWPDHISHACAFLEAHQREDGGWGESYLSCVQDTYVEHRESQVVNTSWAILGLIAAGHDKKVIDRGIRYLLKMQEENGDWPQQGISGVFNQNCMITYSSYRNIFPIWALGRFLKI